MVSTFTPNIQFEEPARGDQVGTWDTPVNANETLADLILGGNTTISGAAGSVVLAAAQFQCKTITLNSTLLASITITFPTSFKKSYEIQNTTTGSSQFIITLQTTVAGGQVVAIPPGQVTTVLNDGTNIKFTNLPHVGSYWDFAGSSVPAWVAGCTVPPWLACVGGAVSSATYPTLFSLIGGTLPDTRGRARIALDAGVGRVSSAGSGVPGNTLFGAGGDQLAMAHSHGVTDPTHVHALGVIFSQSGYQTGSGLGAYSNTGSPAGVTTNSAATGVTVNSAFSGAGQNMPPAYVGGITLIRAA